MSVTTTTHLNFRGQARAALEFYRSVFGGEVQAVTYADAHDTREPAEADQLMWGQVRSDQGLHLMAYDVPARLPYDAGVNAVFVSVGGSDPDELRAAWHGLRDGATVVQELAPAGWSPLYGMLRDRFGVTWVLDLEVAGTPA
ncbi:VOC family protein [Auraticoccus sp. F435]|uniref:VOC family protein n=1 Tax=Auraticoccus cholistanensis TaxID=2656650 RepID=A0A6A9UUB5_9ACTN|nr:VOC family protein [Auraticoccus cholistanensis]MVA76271.1 VOC family protein [Auraticoccus cholistanensis]